MVWPRDQTLVTGKSLNTVFIVLPFTFFHHRDIGSTNQPSAIHSIIRCCTWSHWKDKKNIEMESRVFGFS